MKASDKFAFPVQAENSISLHESSDPIKRQQQQGKKRFSPAIISPLIALDLIELPSEIA